MIGFIKKKLFSKKYIVQPPTKLDCIINVDGIELNCIGILIEKNKNLVLKLSLSKKQINQKMEKEKTKKERMIGIWK